MRFRGRPRVSRGKKDTPILATPWFSEAPIKLQQFLDSHCNDFSLRIFREFVIRLPMSNATKDEVLALVEDCGSVEYVGKLDAVEVGGHSEQHCHILRFEDGVEAIKAFFTLNGAVIDPVAQQCALDEMMQELKQELPDGDAAQANVELPKIDCTDHTNLIFVTADFFRLAFSIGSAPPLLARSALVTPAHVATSSRAPAAGGFACLQRQLREEALTMSHYHPIVCSYGVEWDQFSFLVNYFSFIHPQREPYSIERIETVAGLLHDSAMSQAVAQRPSVCLAGAVRTVHSGLQLLRCDAFRVLQRIGSSQHAEAELLGVRPIRHFKSPLSMWRWFASLSGNAKLFLLLLALILVFAALLFWLVE